MSSGSDSLQQRNQLFELRVIFIAVPGFDVYSIILLPAEILLEVVDYYGTFKRTAQTRQIFYVVSLTGEVVLKMYSVLTVEAVCN